jgi:hypothetical protein
LEARALWIVVVFLFSMLSLTFCKVIQPKQQKMRGVELLLLLGLLF